MDFGQTLGVYLDEESGSFAKGVALLHALLCKDFSEMERRDFMYLFDTTTVIMDDIFSREDHWIRYVEIEVEKLIAYNVLLRKRVKNCKSENKFWRLRVEEQNESWKLAENKRKELAAEVLTYRDVSNDENLKSDIESWCIRCDASDEEMDEFLYSSILGVEEEEEKEMKESYGKKMNTIDTLKVIRIPKDNDAFTWTFAVLRALLSSDFSKQMKDEVIRILDGQHVDIPKTRDRWIRYVEIEVGKLIAYQISADRECKQWGIRFRILASLAKYWFDRDILSNNRVTSYSQLRRSNGVLDSTFWESERKYWLERCILTEKRLQEIWTSGLFQIEEKDNIAWKFKLSESPLKFKERKNEEEILVWRTNVVEPLRPVERKSALPKYEEEEILVRRTNVPEPLRLVERKPALPKYEEEEEEILVRRTNVAEPPRRVERKPEPLIHAERKPAPPKYGEEDIISRLPFVPRGGIVRRLDLNLQTTYKPRPAIEKKEDAPVIPFDLTSESPVKPKTVREEEEEEEEEEITPMVLTGLYIESPTKRKPAASPDINSIILRSRKKPEGSE